MKIRLPFPLPPLALVALILAFAALAHAEIYVTNPSNNTVGKYRLDGTPAAASLISGVTGPTGIAISGGKLYVASWGAGIDDGKIGVYDAATGHAINPAFITGLVHPQGIAIDGNNLFVVDFDYDYDLGTHTITYHGQVEKFTIAGESVNADSVIIEGLTDPVSLALSTDAASLFVADNPDGVYFLLGKYDAATGEAINASFHMPSSAGSTKLVPGGMATSGDDLFLAIFGEVAKYYVPNGSSSASVIINGLTQPTGLAILGDRLFVADADAGKIGEYTTAGAVVNAALISDRNHPFFLAVTADSAKPAPPTVRVAGKKKITTAKAALKIKGTAADANGNLLRVEVKVGKAAYKKAAGRAKWAFVARRLLRGRNVILVRAVDTTGRRSRVTRLVILRR